MELALEGSPASRKGRISESPAARPQVWLEPLEAQGLPTALESLSSELAMAGQVLEPLAARGLPTALESLSPVELALAEQVLAVLEVLVEVAVRRLLAPA